MKILLVWLFCAGIVQNVFGQYPDSLNNDLNGNGGMTRDHEEIFRDGELTRVLSKLLDQEQQQQQHQQYGSPQQQEQNQNRYAQQEQNQQFGEQNQNYGSPQQQYGVQQEQKQNQQYGPPAQQEQRQQQQNKEFSREYSFSAQFTLPFGERTRPRQGSRQQKQKQNSQQQYGPPAQQNSQQNSQNYGLPVQQEQRQNSQQQYGTPAQQNYGLPAQQNSQQNSQNYGPPAQQNSQQQYSTSAQQNSQPNFQQYGTPNNLNQINSGYSNNNQELNQGQRSSQNEEDAKRFVYVYVPPVEPTSAPRARVISAPVQKPDKNYQIIFVKAPAPAGQQPIEIQMPSPPEQKTLVYLLVKKPGDQESEIRFTKPASTTPSPPEVFFVKYRRNENLPSTSDLPQDMQSNNNNNNDEFETERISEKLTSKGSQGQNNNLYSGGYEEQSSKIKILQSPRLQSQRQGSTRGSHYSAPGSKSWDSNSQRMTTNNYIPPRTSDTNYNGGY